MHAYIYRYRYIDENLIQIIPSKQWHKMSLHSETIDLLEKDKWLKPPPKAAVPSYLCDQLQIIYIVLFCDNELMDVSLPFPFGRRQHIQKMQVCTPCKTQKDPRFYLGSFANWFRSVAVQVMLNE